MGKAARVSVCLSLGALLVFVTPVLGADRATAQAHKTTTDTSKPSWPALVSEGTRAGVDKSRLESLSKRLATAGMTPETGRAILRPAIEAGRDDLPSRPILNKIDEGLLKRAAPDALAQASARRLAFLRRADELLRGHFASVRRRQLKGLLSSMGLAMESGLPESAVQMAVAREPKRSVAQVKSVVEAGEALYLAGFGGQEIEPIMADCLDRNLGRNDVLRVVRFATEKRKAGMDGTAVRAALWGGDGSVSRAPPAPGAGGSSPAPSGPGPEPTSPPPK